MRRLEEGLVPCSGLDPLLMQLYNNPCLPNMGQTLPSPRLPIITFITGQVGGRNICPVFDVVCPSFFGLPFAFRQYIRSACKITWIVWPSSVSTKYCRKMTYKLQNTQFQKSYLFNNGMALSRAHTSAKAAVRLPFHCSSTALRPFYVTADLLWEGP